MSAHGDTDRRGERLRDVRRERRRPAFILQALLTADIPPYLTDQAGMKLAFPDDSLAAYYQSRLDTDPASF